LGLREAGKPVLFSPQLLSRSPRAAPNPFAGAGATALAFLNRTTGLDSTHIAAYIALLNGLDTDSLTTKLDVLHVYATQDSTTAGLNLVSTSYTAFQSGSPTFTTDRGFTGVNNSASVYIDTIFNPTSASSPNYVQNSAHISAWSVSNIGTDSKPIMGAQTGGGATTQIYPKFTDNNAYFRINDAGSLAGVANSNSSGHYISNRSTSSAVQGYRNGSSILSSGADTSNGVPNVSFTTIGFHTDSFPFVFGSAYQCAMASIGSSLSGTDATNFYNRLRTYMTAIGVP